MTFVLGKQEKSFVSGGGSEGRDEEECVFPSWEGDSSWTCCGQSVHVPVNSGPLSDGLFHRDFRSFVQWD